MRKVGFIALAIAAACSGAVQAAVPESGRGSVLQLYTYELKDRPLFEQGYRAHLSWHVGQKDKLVWYAWTVQSGLRRGLFIDGTAGATFSQLDARPNPTADAQDFAKTAAPYATPVNIETWQLWAEPSIATPLEDLSPSPTIDVFHLRTLAGNSGSFERMMTAMTRNAKSKGLKLTWYRKLRGGEVPAYMLMLARRNWGDIDATGSGTLASTLASAYGAQPAEIDELLKLVASADVETWSYAPRLSLMPGGAVPE